jgi:twitching motility protein PilT
MSIEKFSHAVQRIMGVAPKFSDIHLTSNKPVAYRIDNDVVKLEPQLIFSHEEIENFVIESGRSITLRDTDFAVTSAGYRWRINFAHCLAGFSIVGRKIPNDIPFIGDLGVPEQLAKLARQVSGLLIVTGVTGSGKSTTLAALLEMINQTKPLKIITLEDPIEFVYVSKLADIMQREVETHTESFARGIKAAMREDPDIILVGEIRDLETAEAAFKAAETGHLVFATLHADNAKETIDRLVSLFENDKNSGMRLSTLSSVLIGTLSQKLIPKVGGGRVLATELMLNTGGIASIIRSGESARIQTILETSSSLGMMTLNQHLEKLFSQGLITRETARDFSYHVESLKV